MVYKTDIRRSKRKTVSLCVTKEGKLLVRCPLRLPKKEIDAIIAKHAAWIEKHMGLQAAQAEARGQFSFSDGQKLFYLGREYTIRQGMKNAVKIEGEEIFLPAENRQEAAMRWYRERAKEVIAQRVDEYARRMGVEAKGVTITLAKTRWGSCSAKDSLCFSFRLILAPQKLVDAIVAHEIAHIKVKDHSKRFYAELETYMPDYWERHALLRQFEQRIPF